jgi:hypothetical protein
MSKLETNTKMGLTETEWESMTGLKYLLIGKRSGLLRII